MVLDASNTIGASLAVGRNLFSTNLRSLCSLCCGSVSRLANNAVQKRSCGTNTKPAKARTLMAIAGFLISCVVVVVLGEIFFQVLPKLSPRIKDILPSQYAISYVQTVPAMLALPIMMWPFFTVFLPFHVEEPFTSLQGWAHIVTVLYLWINMMFNYLCTVVVSPGYPPKREQQQSCKLNFTACGKCQRIRQSGTHHCSWCRTCVEMMSHHCPFTNNCTGRRNYVYYVSSFLVYLFFGLVYGSYVTFGPFTMCIERFFPASIQEHALINPSGSRAENFTNRCDELGDYLLLFTAAITMSLFIGVLLSYHIFLLLADLSVMDLLHALSNSTFTSLWDLTRTLLYLVFMKKKTRFIALVYNQKSRWWKFFVPSFVDSKVPLKDE